MVKLAFVSSSILLLALLGGHAEEAIAPNSPSGVAIVIEPIKPAPVSSNLWVVDDVAVFRIDKKGHKGPSAGMGGETAPGDILKILYLVDGVSAWSGEARPPYDFRTSFRGVTEGYHAATFRVEDELGNITEKNFIIEVRHR